MTSQDVERDESYASSWSGKYNSKLLLTVSAATIVAYLVTSPPIYSYGVGDQTNQLPLIRHTMDPTYLANDWVVGVRTGFTSSKFFYNQVVAKVASVIGLPEAVFVVYLFSVSVILVGTWIFVSTLVDDELAATVAVGMLLSHSVAIPGMIPFPPDLGGNALIQSYLRTSVLANAFVVTGLASAVKTRYRLSFFALGLATLFHVTNGFWIALTTGLCIVAVEAGTDLQAGRFESGIRKVPWDAALIYGLISSVAIVPLLLANLGSTSGFEAAYVMAWVRHPHHYVLSTWDVFPTVLTIVFMLGSIALIFRYRAAIFPDTDRTTFAIVYLAVISAILFFGGYVFTELLPIGTVIKLTPFRTEDFLYIVLYAGLAKLIVIGLQQLSRHTSIDASTLSIFAVLGIIVVGVIVWSTPVVLIQFGVSPIDSKLGFSEGQSVTEMATEIYVVTPSYENDLEATYDWIESETPRDAVFLAPPSQDGFRLATSRAMVVNVKSFPFKTDAMLEWERRMNAVCDGDIRQFERGATAIAEKCDERYSRLSRAEVRSIGETYGADWLLTTNSSYDLPLEYSKGEYNVYRITGDSGDA